MPYSQQQIAIQLLLLADLVLTEITQKRQIQFLTVIRVQADLALMPVLTQIPDRWQPYFF